MAEGRTVPMVSLGGGVEVPQLGLGVFKVRPEHTAGVVAEALRAGYRHIDTAAGYENEAGVGRAIREASVDPADIFVTTKCFNDAHGYQESQDALRASLERLGLGAVDLYLIHWPVPARDRYVETWRGLIELRRQGLARSIGVSNFQPAHLDRLVAETGVTPQLNQVELHPYLVQARLREKHRRLGIVTEAWSPLARGEVLADPTIGAIAAAHGATPSQVVIQWHLTLGNVVIPKSSNARRMQENLGALDLELSDAEIARISGLDENRRVGPDPETLVDPRAPGAR